VNDHTPHGAVALPPEPGSAAWVDDRRRAYELGAAKGGSPDHTAARRTIIMDFLGFHVPKTAANPQPFLATVDFAQPVRIVNGRALDIDNPKATGFLGLGRKPAYLRSEKMLPQKDDDPLYALEYFAKA
jgi:hypothetical protein